MYWTGLSSWRIQFLWKSRTFSIGIYFGLIGPNIQRFARSSFEMNLHRLLEKSRRWYCFHWFTTLGHITWFFFSIICTRNAALKRIVTHVRTLRAPVSTHLAVCSRTQRGVRYWHPNKPSLPSHPSVVLHALLVVQRSNCVGCVCVCDQRRPKHSFRRQRTPFERAKRGTASEPGTWSRRMTFNAKGTKTNLKKVNVFGASVTGRKNHKNEVLDVSK